VGYGAYELEIFRRQISDVRVQALFRKLGVEVGTESASGLFHLLDTDKNGSLDVDKFTYGLDMVQGLARSLDLAKVHADVLLVKESVRTLSRAFHQFCLPPPSHECSLPPPPSPRRVSPRLSVTAGLAGMENSEGSLQRMSTKKSAGSVSLS